MTNFNELKSYSGTKVYKTKGGPAWNVGGKFGNHFRVTNSRTGQTDYMDEEQYNSYFHD